MASYNVHLAIGKRYLQKQGNILDTTSFLKGLIDPDLTLDKRLTHYTIPNKNETLISHLEKKVGLYEYLEKNKINSDYEKGVFLHLITDYLFFNYFISKDYLAHISYEDFCNDLYYSYKVVDKYLEEKYDIDYQRIPSYLVNEMNKTLKNIDNPKAKCIIPLNNLDNFIEYVSSIDLNNYAMQLKLSKKNILP